MAVTEKQEIPFGPSERRADGSGVAGAVPANTVAQDSKNHRLGHVGDYQILSEIGAGGMGVVYKAFDLKLQRVVALKFVNSDRSCNTFDCEQLLREARAASALDHENIANIHTVEQTGDGRLFIVMAYYEGQSLDAKIIGESLPVDEAINIIRQIGRGLCYAHSHNVVHGDIKPSNVIITTAGVAKIVDFGLARFAGIDASTRTASFGGTLLAGTLPYISPEQAKGAGVSARADIWSLGVLSYRLLACRLPFQGENAASLINAILNADPDPILNISPKLNTVLQRALCKDPTGRYQSCTEFLRELPTVDAGDGAPDIRKKPRNVFRSTIRRKIWPVSLRLSLRKSTIALALGLLALVSFPRTYRWITNKPVAYESYLKGEARLQRFDVPENLNAAITLFEQTIQKDPNFALAYAGLAEAYRDKYRVEQNPKWLDVASNYCRKAVELNSQLPDVYITLGRIHYNQAKYDLALQEIQRALDLDPVNSKAMLAMADLRATLGQNDEAEKLYRKLIALRPNDWQVFNNFGFYYWGLARYAEAADQFREMVKLIPDSSSSHLNLAIMLEYLGNVNEAESELKRALELGPSYHTYATLGNLYYNQGRYSEAVTMTEKALAMNRSDYRVWANLAQQYEAIGRRDEAKKALENELLPLQQMASMKETEPKIQADLAYVLARLSRLSDAARHLEAAVALAPAEPSVLITIAETYELLGSRTKAFHFLSLAVQGGYSFEELKRDPELQTLLSDPKIYIALSTARQLPTSVQK